MSSARRLVAVTLLLLAAFGCKRKPTTPPDVVMRLNDRQVRLEEFKQYLSRNAGTDLAQIGPEVASAMLDQYAEELILSEYAAAHGVEIAADKVAIAVRRDPGSTVLEKRDEMRRQKLIAELATQIAEPTEPQVNEYYAQHPDEFKSDEQVRVRQILVHDETVANDIVKKLRGGADFAQISAELSLAPNAKKGGDIGWVSRGELPRMFEDQIFALQPGQVSEVIRTDSSFHIFKADERRPAGVLTLVAAAPLIQTRLREDATRDRMTQLVATARKEMQIAVLTKRLPFRYTGMLPKSENE